MATQFSTQDNKPWKKTFFTIWSGQALSILGTMPLRVDETAHPAILQDYLSERKINIPPAKSRPSAEKAKEAEEETAAEETEGKDDQEYMRSGLAGTHEGMTRADVRAIVGKIIAPFHENLNVNFAFLDDHTQIPGDPYDPETIQEVWDRPSNTIYFVAKNLENQEDVERTLAHALWGHVAAERFGGDKYINLLREVVLMYGKSGLADIAEDYGLDLWNEGDQFQAAREMLARMAEENIKPNFMARVYSRIRDIMRDLGFAVKWTDDDSRDFLIRARRAAQRGLVPARTRHQQFFPDYQDYSRTAKDIWGTVGRVTLGSTRRKFFEGPVADAVPAHVKSQIAGRHGMQMPDLKESYRGMKEKIKENFMQHWPTLDPGLYPHAQDILRRFQDAAHAAIEEVLYRIQSEHLSVALVLLHGRILSIHVRVGQVNLGLGFLKFKSQRDDGVQPVATIGNLGSLLLGLATDAPDVPLPAWYSVWPFSSTVVGMQRLQTSARSSRAGVSMGRYSAYLARAIIELMP